MLQPRWQILPDSEVGQHSWRDPVQQRVVEGFFEAATELEKGEIRFANQRLTRALNALFTLRVIGTFRKKA